MGASEDGSADASKPSMGLRPVEAKLGSRFRLIAPLGEGRHTSVFLAEDRELAQRVALKIPRPPSDERAATRLLREHTALRRVEHPNVLRSLAGGHTANGAPFLATQFHDGVTLADVIASHGGLPEAWARQAVLQVLAALGAVHASGGVHGDVTPANCMCVGFASFDAPPQICLLDFGSARWDSADMAYEPAAGTPAYMAPEQAQQGVATPESDLYSVGIIAYELLVGVPPFRASTTTELLWQHLHEPVRRPRELVPHAAISPSFERAILRAARKAPEERFASADEFASALGPGAESGPDAEATAREDDLRPVQEARAALLARVREHWIEGVLGRTTDGVILVRQPLAWVARGDGSPGADPTSIVAAFEGSPRGLLILGDPGHGKTINLLRLARFLSDRATDAAGMIHALPVVFTLSSWNHEDTDLSAWMQRELVTKYLISSREAARLLAAAAVVPLLDGLDDVPLRARDACADAIDAFRRRHPAQALVVTCRTDDYATFPRPLAIESVVRLGPLATEDIGRQLRASSQTALVEAIGNNSLLDELSHTPMLLHVMRVAFRDSFTFRGALADQEQAVHELFDAFVASAVRRSPGELEERTARAHLGSVARLMTRTARTVLLIEDVQPSWLTDRRDRVLYAFASRGLVAFLFCASIVLSVMFTPLANQGFHATPWFAFRLAGAGTLALTAAFGLAALRSAAVTGAAPEARTWPVLRALAAGVLSGAVTGGLVFLSERHPLAFVMGMETGIVGAAILGLSRRKCAGTRSDVLTVERSGWSWRHIDPRSVAVLFAVSAALYAGAAVLDGHRSASYIALAIAVLGLGVLGHRSQDTATRITPNVGVWRTAQNALAIGGVAFAVTTLLFGISYGLGYGACVGLTIGTVMALWLGGIDVIHHVVLRLVLHARGSFDLRIVRILDAAVDRGLLRRAGNGYMFMHAMLLRHMAEER